MLHPLHTEAVLASLRVYHDKFYEHYRHTGRSTIQAFETLARAMREPGVWIPIRDHFGTHNADFCLELMMRDMLQKLAFQHFKFSVFEQRRYVCFGEPQTKHPPR